MRPIGRLVTFLVTANDVKSSSDTKENLGRTVIEKVLHYKLTERVNGILNGEKKTAFV